MAKKDKKFRRRFNPRLIKHHATYSTQEIVDLLHVHINTVGGWYELGLRTIDDQRPYLVFGQDLIDFLTRRNLQMKRKCDQNEFFCCKCKAPRKAQNGAVRFRILNSTKVMIEGVCMQCGTRMNKLWAVGRMRMLSEIFSLREVQQELLLECGTTSVITGEKGSENGNI